jgi:hypothetical protein
LCKYEDSPEQTQQALNAAGLADDTDMSILFLSPGSSRENNIELVKAHLNKHPKTKLVAIETLDGFLNIEDSNNNDMVVKAFDPFREQLVLPYKDTAFILLHQYSKAQEKQGLYRIRGAGNIAGLTSTKLFLEVDPDNEDKRIVWFTTRDAGKMERTYLEFDPVKRWSELVACPVICTSEIVSVARKVS